METCFALAASQRASRLVYRRRSPRPDYLPCALPYLPCAPPYLHSAALGASRPDGRTIERPVRASALLSHLSAILTPRDAPRYSVVSRARAWPQMAPAPGRFSAAAAPPGMSLSPRRPIKSGRVIRRPVGRRGRRQPPRSRGGTSPAIRPSGRRGHTPADTATLTRPVTPSDTAAEREWH